MSGFAAYDPTSSASEFVEPVSVTADETGALARALVDGLITDPSSGEATDRVTRVGMDKEGRIRRSYTLQKQHVKDAIENLKASDEGTTVSRSVAELRQLTDENAHKTSWLSGAFRWFPGTDLEADKQRPIRAFYEAHGGQVEAIKRHFEEYQRRLDALLDEDRRFRANLAAELTHLSATRDLAIAVKDELLRRVRENGTGERKAQLENCTMLVTARIDSITKTYSLTELELALTDQRIVDSARDYQQVSDILTSLTYVS